MSICQHPGCTKQPGYGIDGKRTHCVAHKPKGAVSMNKKQQCKHKGCTKRPGFLVDLLASLPLHYFLGDGDASTGQAQRIGKMARLARFTRVFRLLRFFKLARAFQNKLGNWDINSALNNQAMELERKLIALLTSLKRLLKFIKDTIVNTKGVRLRLTMVLMERELIALLTSLKGPFVLQNIKMCLSCGLIHSEKKYDYYCASCFLWNFSTDSRVNLVRTKSKELRVRNYLNEHFEGFIHDRSINFGGCDCLHRRRVDFRKMIEGTMLAIEVDENGHRTYNARDEENRYNDLFMAYSGKWIFIRFNPDSYIDTNGNRRNPRMETRLDKLKETIEIQIMRIQNANNEDMMEIIPLFLG